MDKKKNAFIAIVIVTCVIVFGIFYFVILKGIDTHDRYEVSATGSLAKTVPALAPSVVQHPGALDHDAETLTEKFDQMGVSLEDQLVKELIKYYGATISEKAPRQVSMISGKISSAPGRMEGNFSTTF
jgi:hypothetical protein